MTKQPLYLRNNPDYTVRTSVFDYEERIGFIMIRLLITLMTLGAWLWFKISQYNHTDYSSFLHILVTVGCFLFLTYALAVGITEIINLVGEKIRYRKSLVLIELRLFEDGAVLYQYNTCRKEYIQIPYADIYSCRYIHDNDELSFCGKFTEIKYEKGNARPKTREITSVYIPNAEDFLAELEVHLPIKIYHVKEDEIVNEKA